MANKDMNVFDYMIWRGDISFAVSDFNEVDALILTIFSYLDFSCAKDKDPISFCKAMEMINALPEEAKYNGPTWIIHDVLDLANAALKTKRFADMEVCSFVNTVDETRELQFSAVTFILPDRTAFVAFRGTDNSLVGWKEDFNMSFTDCVPAQVEAARYLENYFQKYEYLLRVGGHSKGGNLAVWAAAKQRSEYKKRILKIYSNDGPGFREEFLEGQDYQEIRGKIDSFVPNASIVGVLMAHDEYKTIMSTENSFMQHDPFSWIICCNQFCYDEERSASGRHFEKLINGWLRSMSEQEREQFVEGVYEIISASDAKVIQDFDNNKLRNLFLMQRGFHEMGIKRQVQLLLSMSKIIFNSDNFSNSPLLSALPDQLREAIIKEGKT